MTTLELARKLDQCLQAQVKLQKERDELLNALSRVVVYHSYAINGSNMRYVADVEYAFNQARAAIAKATGNA